MRIKPCRKSGQDAKRRLTAAAPAVLWSVGNSAWAAYGPPNAKAKLNACPIPADRMSVRHSKRHPCGLEMQVTPVSQQPCQSGVARHPGHDPHLNLVVVSSDEHAAHRRPHESSISAAGEQVHRWV